MSGAVLVLQQHIIIMKFFGAAQNLMTTQSLLTHTLIQEISKKAVLQQDGIQTLCLRTSPSKVF